MSSQMFNESDLKSLKNEFEEKTKAHEAYAKYVPSFLNEIKDYLNSSVTLKDGRKIKHKDDLLYKIRKSISIGYERIHTPFFTYYSTSFGDKDTKDEVARKIYKDDKTFYDASIRLGYHELCKRLDENDETETPPPKYIVFDKTNLNEKIAELFGTNFSVFKKWRQIDSEEEFANEKIRTWEVTLFLEFHPE